MSKCAKQKIKMSLSNFDVQFKIKNVNQRTEGPESRTDGETLIFWD